MRGLLAAVALLTRVPVAGRIDDPRDHARAAPWLPVVGAAVGLLVAAVYALAISALPSLPAAVIATGVGVLVTGAFHEDGLADTADAFGGRRSREEALRILEDPRLGTYGVTAVVLSILVRVASLAALDGPTALAALPAIHALARASAVGALAVFPAASPEGLGADHARDLSPARGAQGVVGAVLLAGVTLGWWAVPAAAAALGLGLAIGAAARRRIGGVTGDILGAMEQGVEMLLLVLTVVAAGAGIDLPWW